MPARAQIGFWHWTGFLLAVLLFLALDLGVFHRRSRIVKTKDALAWGAAWLSLAMLFAGALKIWRGPEESIEFITGYFVEFSLSLDNVAAIALLFAFFN